MLRRLVCTAAAVVAFAACSTSPTEPAASVNGTELSMKTATSLVDQYARFNARQLPEATYLEDVYEAQGARQIVNAWVYTEVQQQVLSDAGGSITPEDLAVAEQTLIERGFTDVADPLRSFLVDVFSTTSGLERVLGVDTDPPFLAALNSAAVTISPVFGRWGAQLTPDRNTFHSVVALDQPDLTA